MIEALRKDKQSMDVYVYTLSRGNQEQDRLKNQHNYITESALEGRLIYDNEVKLMKCSKILDSATGTGAWILSLSKELDDSMTLIGADISSVMFPFSHPRNVQFVETSVTKMPEEWTNSFDFINQRLLVAALTESQWLKAMNELLRVLKPGGAIQLIDFCSHFPSGEGLENTEELRKMFIAIQRNRGHLIDCGNRLLQFASDRGFEQVEENIRKAPIGKSWGHIGKLGSENFRKVFNEYASAVITEGGLGIYSSDEEIISIVEGASEEWDNHEGLFFEIAVVTARKPM